MTPRVLVVGRKRGIFEAVHQKFGVQPAISAEGGNEADIVQASRDHLDIRLAAMGTGRDDTTRGRLMGVIEEKAPLVSIHLKDRERGAGGMADFVVKRISTFLTPKEVLL